MPSSVFKMPQINVLANRICVVYITLMTVMSYQNCNIWSLAAKPNPVCDTPECRTLGNIFKSNMNESVEPCNDFYDYVCNKWSVNNPKPNFVHMWHVSQTLQQKTYADLKNIMEDKTVSKTTEFEQAKALYRACMNIPDMERVDSETISKIMKEVFEKPLLLPKNKEPSIVPWKIDQKYIQLTGESAFFDSGILSADSKRNEFITDLNCAASPYGMLHRYEGWKNPRELEKYKNFLNKIIGKVTKSKSKLSWNINNSDIDQVIQFREELRQYVDKVRFQRPVRKTIQKFQEWYDRQEFFFTPTKSKIDWLQIVRTIHKTPEDPNGSKIAQTSLVDVRETYFMLLAKLFETTSNSVIVNHVHLYFLEKHLELDAQMILDLNESITDGLRPTGRVRYEPARWQICITKHNMKTALARMYVKSYFPPKNKIAVEKLFEETKELQIKQILDSKWLNFDATQLSVKKIRSIKSMMGYPEWEKENPNSRVANIIPDPVQVTAFYAGTYNFIGVTAANLQSPVFVPNMPYVIDYGATVSMLAHELYHGFDADGIKYGPDGEFEPWSEDMYAKYEEKATCFRNHYEKYARREYRKLGLCPTGTCVDTFSEDMADAMGLKLAYMGYRQKLYERKSCPVLPGFETFGCEKLFFIAFANKFCASLTNAVQERIVFRDSHNIPRVRINAVVANMKEFSDAFGCSINDPLKDQLVCNIWK